MFLLEGRNAHPEFVGSRQSAIALFVGPRSFGKGGEIHLWESVPFGELDDILHFFFTFDTDTHAVTLALKQLRVFLVLF